MKIGGLQQLTLIDFPDEIAAVVFVQGCNFRCPYCHNPELVDPKQFNESLKEADIFDFLKSRIGKLTGVVVTGGEPCIQSGLKEFISKIKVLGFKVKLDTNGTRPDVLKQLIDESCLDFIAMDIKAPIGKYSGVTKVDCLNDCIQESIDLIKKSGLNYEFRTTVVKSLLNEDDLREIKAMIGNDSNYRTQDFVNGGKVLDLNMLE